MITISAMKWAPPFAAGQVRDHRLRWVLNEVGWPYQVRLIDAVDLASDGYRKLQPFGQVPYLQEDGRPTLFESGAIVIDVATRAGRLIPPEGDDRSLAIAWVLAALNTVEPTLSNVAEVEYFLEDPAQKDARRPLVLPAAHKRLREVADALGDRSWLVTSDFTVADLMMASVFKIARGLKLLDDHPSLVAYQDRCLAREAYKKAEADQRATIARHRMADMRYDEAAALT